MSKCNYGKLKPANSDPIIPLVGKNSLKQLSNWGTGQEEKGYGSLDPFVKNGLTVRLLKMRVIKNMTKNGKYARFSALVAVGNGNGAIGIAHAKALNAPDALSKATRSATSNMEYFHRWQDRTIFHDDEVKFKSSIIRVRPGSIHSGRRCHPAISEICRCLGIADISAKCHGSRNPLNVANAFLLALRRQQTPELLASEHGLRVADIAKVYQCEPDNIFERSCRYSTLAFK